MSRTILKKQIERCLQDFPETANSDIALTIKVWQVYYDKYIMTSSKTGKQAILLDNLFFLPREDNIKRIRAKFNSKGLYLPTSREVARKRKINEDLWLEFMGYPPRNKNTQKLL